MFDPNHNKIKYRDTNESATEQQKYSDPFWQLSSTERMNSLLRDIPNFPVDVFEKLKQDKTSEDVHEFYQIIRDTLRITMYHDHCIGCYKMKKG